MGYIRAEGDFHKEIIVERTIKAEIRQEEQSQTRRFFGVHLWNDILLKGL